MREAVTPNRLDNIDGANGEQRRNTAIRGFDTMKNSWIPDAGRRNFLLPGECVLVPIAKPFRGRAKKYRRTKDYNYEKSENWHEQTTSCRRVFLYCWPILVVRPSLEKKLMFEVFVIIILKIGIAGDTSNRV